MLYFAYGSNLNWEQIKSRCPSVRFIGPAVLPDHRLAFTRKSQFRGCGVADAVPHPGSIVWGVVYEIAAEEVAHLDAAEGFQPGRPHNAYIRSTCQVFLNGNNATPLTVAIYFACRQENPPPPNQQYKDLILQGARYWGLPEDYIKEVLESITVA